MRQSVLPLLFGLAAGAGLAFMGLASFNMMRGSQLMPDVAAFQTPGGRIRALDEFVHEDIGKVAARDVVAAQVPATRAAGPSAGISVGMSPASATLPWPDVFPVSVTLGELPLRYRFTPPRLVVVGLTRPLYGHKEVSVILDRIPVPVILVMISGEPVDWRLRNPAGNTLLKVIHGPGSRVLQEPGSAVPVEQQALGRLGTHLDGDPVCQCLRGFFYCHSKPALPLLNEFQVKTGALVYGYAFSRDTTAMMVPTTLLEPSLSRMMSEYRDYRLAKEACLASAVPD